MQLDRVAARLMQNHGGDPALRRRPGRDAIARRCTEVDSGARNIDAILTRTLLPDLAREVLSGLASGHRFEQIDVSPELRWQLLLSGCIADGPHSRQPASRSKRLLARTSLSSTACVGRRDPRPFRFRLSFVSEDHAIVFDKIVGERVCIAVYGPQASRDKQPDPVRYIHGHIRQFAQRERNERYSFYDATPVPWLWFLTNTAGCRIFQDKSAPQIIKQVFRIAASATLKRRSRAVRADRILCAVP